MRFTAPRARGASSVCVAIPARNTSLAVTWLAIATLASFAPVSLLPAQATTGTSAAVERAAMPRAQRETLSGHVTNATGAPLAGVVVIATMAPNRETFADTTNATGMYRITVERGTGDYVLYIAALGMTPARKRITRAGDEHDFTFNATLAAPQVAQLAAVNVAARRPVPQRVTAGAVEAGGAERIPDAMNGALSTDQLGDLNALALATPGATAVDGGYSVLGLGAAQNTVTMNGFTLNGASLPRDVRSTPRVSVSTYDPSRGWFSGSNVSVELGGGGLFNFARGHASLDAPALQVAPYANTAGQQFTNVRASYGAEGPLTWENRHFYALGLEASRRTSDVLTLGNANEQLMPGFGVVAGAAAELRSALTSSAASLLAPALTTRVQENGSFVLRLERNYADPLKGYAPVPTTYGVTMFATGARERGVRLNALSTNSRTGSNIIANGGVQGLFTHYIGKYYLYEARSSLGLSERHESSLLAMPEGRVLIGAAPAPNGSGVSTLAFGGNAYGNRTFQQLTWETTNTFKYFVRGRDAHAVKVTADARFDAVHNTIANNRFGTFTFASLADVASNTPSSFSRVLASPERRGGEWNGFVSIGDNWRVTPRLEVLYGARVEGNVFTTRPAYNADVAALFDVRTDFAPATVHVSPRAGFTWMMAKPGAVYRTGPSGDFMEPTRRRLRGGIGEFRSMTSPSLLADAYAATGLSNATRTILCVGQAVPLPDWQRYDADAATIPTSCVDGSPSVFADAAPVVRAVAPGYQPPTSWRANLQYSSRSAVVDWSAEVVTSLNLHQPGTIDRNFAGVPKFALADDSRPVFVDATAIVPSTGVASNASARLSPTFGRVVMTTSDLRSVSNQLTLSVRPVPTYMRGWYAAGWYTLANNRASSRGFDGDAFGSPATRTWTRGNYDVRHQVLTQFGYTKQGVTISGLLRVQSGTPYTPTIAGDVNGDGLLNDRAFIAKPSSTSNTALAADMRALLAGNTNARRCLESQLGLVARRNSCENPWSAGLNAELTFRQAALKRARITSIALNFSNPLAGVDQLLHGSAGMRGWGSTTIADPTLYSVRAFDPATRTFTYAVNARFAQPATLSALARTPFRMTIDVAMDLGQPVARQQLNKWLRPGRAGNTGTRLGRDDLKKRYENNVPDPFRTILLQTDSLLLSRAQVEALQQAQVPYRAKMDTVWTGLAAALAALPDNFDDARALKLQEAAVDAGWEVTRVAVHESLGPILSRLQMALANGLVQDLYRATAASKRRIYMPQ